MAEQKSSITKSVSKYKLVFVGDQSVGKTSIIHRFIYDNFTGVQQPTVGIDFVSKTLHLENKTIRLQLWDTAGQERFRSLIPSYIRDSNTAIIVYDTTNQTSFQSVTKWIEYVREERGNDAIIVLVGNKVDIVEKRQVSKEDGENLSKLNQILFFEASAKTGANIVNIFKTIAIQLQSQENKDNNETALPPENSQIIKNNSNNNNNNTNIQLQKSITNDKQTGIKINDKQQCQC